MRYSFPYLEGSSVQNSQRQSVNSKSQRFQENVNTNQDKSILNPPNESEKLIKEGILLVI